MKSKEIEKMINSDKFQIFVLSCPAGIPLSFARHPWVVINEKGIIYRYEVFWRIQGNSLHWSHIHRDFYKPFQGIPVLPFSEKHIWNKIIMHGYVEDDENSIAKEMVDYIKNSIETYPYRNKYSFIGENSNTYISWILNKFPNINIKLPWNAFGK